MPGAGQAAPARNAGNEHNQAMKAKNYTIFTRTWWRNNPACPNGLEPNAGRKTTIAHAETEEEARAICQRWNAAHDPGRLSRKAEYSSR